MRTITVDVPTDDFDLLRERTIDDLIAELTRVRDSAPEEFRSSVFGEFYSYEEGHSVYFRACYSRPESDEDRAQKEEELRAGEAASVARQRAEYERLRAIFGFQK